MLGETTKNRRPGLALLLAALIFGSIGFLPAGSGSKAEISSGSQKAKKVKSGVPEGVLNTGAQEGSAPGAEQQRLQSSQLYSDGMQGIPSLSAIRLRDSFQSSSFTLSVESAKAQDLNIEIYDLTGTKILCRQQELKEGENVFAFNKAHISPGIYYLRASVRDMEITKKFMN